MLSQKTKEKINQWLDTFQHGEQIIFNEDKTTISYIDECGCIIDSVFVMDEELKEIVAERICEDYDGQVKDFGERNIILPNSLRVDEITYDEKGDAVFRFYNTTQLPNQTGGFIRYELFPNDEELYKILDEFYAWY